MFFTHFSPLDTQPSNLFKSKCQLTKNTTNRNVNKRNIYKKIRFNFPTKTNLTALQCSQKLFWICMWMEKKIEKLQKNFSTIFFFGELRFEPEPDS